MNEDINKIYNFLGLAKKANKVLSGDQTCEKLIKSEKAKLVIVSIDASDNTKKKFTDLCNYRSVNKIFFGEKELLGKYTGKDIRSVLVITDMGFAKKILEMVG